MTGGLQETKECKICLAQMRGALLLLLGAELVSVFGSWASWEVFCGLRVFNSVLGK